MDTPLPDYNYAFIDSQNLNLGIKKLGWKLDYKKFRVYLAEKYHVQHAYMFIGFIKGNQGLYDRLEESGFILQFKPTIFDSNGLPKGNVDADLVLHTMIHEPYYDKALIISSDGDFYSLVNYLYTKDKLKTVLGANQSECSKLLRKTAREKINFMNNLRNKLEYLPK